MRILYITQWFEPEPVFKGLGFAKALAARGHDVEVVTGFPNYPAGKIYPGYRMSLCRSETIDGIRVHRLPLYPSHGDSSLGRIVNYLSFAASVALFTLPRARRFDVIYAYSPVTIGLGAVLGALFSGRPVITEVQDLWPESVVKSGMSGTSYMETVLHAVCNFVYRRSARIVSQSKGIRDCLVARGVPAEKISVIYNWADEKAVETSEDCDLTPFRLKDRFNIIYGGNFGRMQCLETLVRAAASASQKAPELHLVLVGDGMEKDSLEALVRSLATDNVTIVPSVPRTEIAHVFAAADVLALHLRDDPLFKITIPSKVQFYLAMGKPILAGIEGETADLITDPGAGLVVPPQDEAAMADAMVKLARMPRESLQQMGQRGREAYRSHFSQQAAIDATDNELQSALRGAR